MRTKALVCLAAVAALAIPASAQVYSANIVGYYNVPTTGNLTAMTVSLKNGQNRADQVVPYTAGDNIQVWNGVGWDVYIMDLGSPTQWADGNENPIQLANLPVLGLGKGFFYGKNSTISSLTVVGEVLKGTNSVSLAPGLSAVGSQLPIGGNVDAAGATEMSGANLQLPVGSNVQFWSGAGWTVVIRDTSSATGWADGNENPVPAPTLSVGQGFFIGNNTTAPITWQQWYNY